MSEAQQTPLIDLLRSIPATHRTEWPIQFSDDGTPNGHAMCPVGRLAHEAVEEITRLKSERDNWEQTCKQESSRLLDAYSELARMESENEALRGRVERLRQTGNRVINYGADPKEWAQATDVDKAGEKSDV